MPCLQLRKVVESVAKPADRIARKPQLLQTHEALEPGRRRQCVIIEPEYLTQQSRCGRTSPFSEFAALDRRIVRKVRARVKVKARTRAAESNMEASTV